MFSKIRIKISRDILFGLTIAGYIILSNPLRPYLLFKSISCMLSIKILIPLLIDIIQN